MLVFESKELLRAVLQTSVISSESLLLCMTDVWTLALVNVFI